ncbi:TonB-dependent receptor [Sphingomicrobium sediminis]|uniref:TonB-dependent receptor n=1 Tax=Sphingomicrobium sediminis TaxID=2950949 RepID=A0A9X2J3N7_9SPHN|nr:TonB-dependent receptor [Sphingomicrobium sediminis]MCM8558235.1 TonB-dependent receptor [Sphingomicrobium sediminis]
MMTLRSGLFAGTAFASLALLPAAAMAQAQQGPQDSQPAAQPATPPDDEAVVITGQRGSILESIDDKRDSDAIGDTLSADQLGLFPDPNVAEGLARIPGIGFQRENDTGEGEFISIRGLDASYNTVLFNGIRTGTADEFRRTALDIVTANNVSSIRVTKSPLPEDASEGIGGVVDIRTRGPLERREGGFLQGDIRDNSFVDNYGYRIAGGYTWVDPSDTIGINIAASYRKTYLDTIYVNPASFTLEQVNAITLNGPNGPVTFVDEDPLTFVPEGFLDPNDFTNEQINFEDNLIDRDNYNISGVIDWRLSDSTVLTLGGRYTRDDTYQTTSNVEFDADNGDIDPDGMGGFLPSDFPDPEVTFEGQIEDSIEEREAYFLRGQTLAGNFTFDYVVGYSRAFEDEPILSIDFTNDFDDIPGGRADNDVTFVPLDFSNPPFAAPLPKDLDVFLQGIDPFCRDDDNEPCGEINDFDEDLVDSLENKRYNARFDTTYDFDDQDGFLRQVKVGVMYERSEYDALRIDISNVDDSLGPNGEFLGVDRSDRFGGSLPDNNAALGDYGLVDGSISSFDRIGDPYASIGFFGVTLFDPDALRDLRDTFRSTYYASQAAPLLIERVGAEEDFYTGYAQFRVGSGPLEIIGGARIEQYEGTFFAPSSFTGSIFFDEGDGGDAFQLVAPNATQTFTSTDNFEVLPRIIANYDISDQFKARFAYTTALARPTFDLLAAEVDGDFDIELTEGVALADATIGDVENVDIDFSLGNPELRNAYSQSFDISLEWYQDRGNAITLAAFYKTIDDFIFNSFAVEGQLDATSQQFDPEAAVAAAPFTAEGRALLQQLGGIDALVALPQASVSIRQPNNGRTAEVYGLELGVFHSFDYLPGALSNLFFTGNVTWQETSIDLELGTLTDDDALVILGLAQAGDTYVAEYDLFNAPEWTGNAALTYQDDNWEATVGYRYAGLQLEEISSFGFTQYIQPRGFVDLDIEYAFRDVGPFNRVTAVLSVNDALDNGRKPTTYETNIRQDFFPNFASFNGRTVTLGLRTTF